MAAGRVNVSRKPESHLTSRKASEFCDGGAGGAKRDTDIVFDDSTSAWGGEVMDVDFQSLPPSPKRRKLSQDVSDKSCGFVPVSNESPLGSISSLTYQTCGSGEREPGQLDEEDFSNAPNIMTSRWASDDDLLEETPTRSGEKKAKSSENESGSHGSDEGCIQRHSSVDEYSSDELQNENGLMEIGEAKDGRPLIHDDFESSDDEESMAPMCVHSSRNMVQASRSVFVYERLGKISEGSYGIVFKARDKETGEVVALKKLKMAKEREGFPLHYLREINLMLSFNHPSIVNVKEVVVDESDEGFGNVFMVMEHMEHDLKGLMQSRKEAYSPSEVKCLMVQLLQGVKYLHDNWVLHRDLKTSNLLVNNKGELKICDFGMSRQYGSPLKPYTSLVVTLWYRAPELLLGANEYSTAVDMWSVGCIMAELLSNKPLFNGETEVQQLNKIFGTLGIPNDKIWPGYSQLPGAKASFANHRYNRLREIFPCPLFTGSPILSDLGLDLLNKLLTYNPEERITAEDALEHPWFSEIPLPMSKEFMPTFPVQRSCRR